jgi:hypothetical protein
LDETGVEIPEETNADERKDEDAEDAVEKGGEELSFERRAELLEAGVGMEVVGIGMFGVVEEGGQDGWEIQFEIEFEFEVDVEVNVEVEVEFDVKFEFEGCDEGI